jgi:hypothetical protein
MVGAMATPERTTERSHGRVAGAALRSRDLLRVVYRDPEHVSERMALYAADRLAEPSRVWAEEKLRDNPDASTGELAAALRSESANIARIDGAVAGTPFYLALVPGYVAYLWQEGRLVLRTAALYGQDPGDPRTTAEMLALRGVHRTPDEAEEALEAVRGTPLPDKPERRRSIRTWVRSARSLLIFGGFMSLPSEDRGHEVRHPRVKAVAGLAAAGVVWLITWALPVTFMIAMAWACESHTRQLGRRVLLYYDGDADNARDAIREADDASDQGHDRRQILRTVALFLSVAIPIGFIAVVDHYRQSTGINWLGALGALVALSLVIAVAVVAGRK